MRSRCLGSIYCSATAASYPLGTQCFLALAVLVGSMIVAVPIGFLCVRYVGIFFGMLTLAFGMLFHSFLFKFYHLTGGDSGMRAPRMTIPGLELERYYQ